ncbi:DUF4231 domain-containing protein [Cryptosporangium aurantiacum]|uniref:SMODS and SLOG-associating 2TM effector domain-containing protein n=1 Tax=Cryptosporangium aurantiacum TaxID=134849 RepID=A0A1M7RM17_9ACTN|nr:DUF4231 domain-containing protein [Cryptosporangium aurantiacum]SHN47128.1 Protein of unknown function [Cryptosporangium aurantiacum]
MGGNDPGTRLSLTSDELPVLFEAADNAALRGQRRTLHCNRARLLGAVVAALGGGLTLTVDGKDLWAFVALIGFVVALVAELTLFVQQPERDWYHGRAVAESVKTLAWKYAVGGSPFPPTLPEADAKRLLRDRVRAVVIKGSDRIVVSEHGPLITESMAALRQGSREERLAVYLRDRISDQQHWYASAAGRNRVRAQFWRLVLVLGEVAAIIAAAGRAFSGWEGDWSGILAAVVASAAAWLGIKRHDELAAAYSVAATELAIAADRLADATEEDWPGIVADAEEAISREHTLWLASRSDPGTTLTVDDVRKAVPAPAEEVRKPTPAAES